MIKDSFKVFSSMEKIMMDKMPVCEELKSASILKNERFSFQIAYKYTPGIRKRLYPVSFEIKSELKNYITVRKVGHVPSEMPLYPSQNDDCVVSDKPGLYPDVLLPMKDNKIYPHDKIIDTLWFTLDIDGDVKAGTYDIEVEFKYKGKIEKAGDEIVTYTASKNISLEIIDAFLPEQKLIHGQWFHTDCIASHYKVETFSDRHWELIESFMRVAVRNGHNVIFTPVFTPPLDTEVGGERPTTQLLDIYIDNGKYSFNFDKMDRWIDLSLKVGYKYFEMPHLFTQWESEFCPKIMATVDGKYQRILGWENKSDSPEYKEFLSNYLPAITAYMEKKGLKERTIFHYSDEPREHHIENYKRARAGADEYLKGWKCVDALSDFNYYKQGLVDLPIVPHDQSDKFLEENVENMWVYYCCGHYDYYSNRLFAYPLWRTRIMGLQLFKNNISGFLSWGYNFYYSEFSIDVLDPFRVTDGGRAFPSGDAFSVYPGDDGECLESTRFVSFHEGLQDIRALELLSDLIGRDKVVELIEDIAGMKITFRDYPTNAYFIQILRRKVNKLIKENISK